jgi:hypothetical protein
LRGKRRSDPATINERAAPKSASQVGNSTLLKRWALRTGKHVYIIAFTSS